MHIFCGIEHILDKYTQMGLLALRQFNFKFFLKKLDAIWHNSCPILHSHQEGTRALSLSHPCQHSLYLKNYYLIKAILTGGRAYLIVVLICTSLTISDIDIFSYICQPFIGKWKIFGEISVHFLCSFLSQVFLFFFFY